MSSRRCRFLTDYVGRQHANLGGLGLSLEWGLVVGREDGCWDLRGLHRL
jgi:hypothetical protein